MTDLRRLKLATLSSDGGSYTENRRLSTRRHDYDAVPHVTSTSNQPKASLLRYTSDVPSRFQLGYLPCKENTAVVATCRTLPTLHACGIAGTVPVTDQGNINCPNRLTRYQSCLCGFFTQTSEYRPIQIGPTLGRLRDLIERPPASQRVVKGSYCRMMASIEY